MERRGFEPLTSAVRGRGYEFEFGVASRCPFHQFPRDGEHCETSADSERQSTLGKGLRRSRSAARPSRSVVRTLGSSTIAV